MEKVYTNKLSIYLIKNEYSSHGDILKSMEGLEIEDINNVGTLYYGGSHVNVPGWIRRFFGDSFSNLKEESEGNAFKIFSASSKAILITSIESRLFAITFGYGHTLLTPGVLEERFGLKVALNTIDPENLKCIDKTNMTAVPKLSKEQMSKDGTIASFGIDVEQDLIQGITGKSKEEIFGKTITGKDGLSISVKFDATNIKEFLRVCLDKYRSLDYKQDFSFIDHVAAIKDPKKIERLDTLLIEQIRNKQFDKVWMAIPEVIAWENVSEFKMHGGDSSLGDDICLPEFLELLSEEEQNNISTYHSKTIECLSASSGEAVASWKAYNCLYCEINNEGTYILSNGAWYEIERDFAQQVNAEFAGFRDGSTVDIEFPNCQKGEHEDKYNDRVAVMLNAFNMDKKTVNHGSRYSKIEFCDILSSDRKLIHVKHYGASSVLSHLFAQGLVAAELFISDEEFRRKVREKLPDNFKQLIPSVKPNSMEYEVVYAVISECENSLDIPFFSKINLRNAKRRLEMFGYKVFFKKISMDA
ncbi:MAG: TIGR04141 family sporadically distributed protein [Candidatus Omnitrophica bacterium]|nr:TIGR04141 family sporadically distributed protein [Candidatus Omnitrophota bacterium]